MCDGLAVLGDFSSVRWCLAHTELWVHIWPGGWPHGVTTAHLLCWVRHLCNAALHSGRCHVCCRRLLIRSLTVGCSCDLGCGVYRRLRLQLQTRTLAEVGRSKQAHCVSCQLPPWHPRGISCVPFMQCYLQHVGWCLGTICDLTCAHRTQSHCVTALHGLQSLCMTASGVG